MHSSSWSSTPIMGMVPLFHLDPAVGGPPLASPDGRWWWDGERWALRADTASAETPVEPPIELPLDGAIGLSTVPVVALDSPAA